MATVLGVAKLPEPFKFVMVEYLCRLTCFRFKICQGSPPEVYLTRWKLTAVQIEVVNPTCRDKMGNNLLGIYDSNAAIFFLRLSGRISVHTFSM